MEFLFGFGMVLGLGLLLGLHNRHLSFFREDQECRAGQRCNRQCRKHGMAKGTTLEGSGGRVDNHLEKNAEKQMALGL